MFPSELPIVMAYCLFCTIIIEAITAFILKLRKPYEQLIVFLVNVLTNPILVFLTFCSSFFLGHTAYYIVLAILEIAVVSAEGFIYHKTIKPKINPFLLSLILNSCSFFLGELINYIF